ncbi:hypothetical protein CesoFtcFv8_025714 [Champsocephalus esox]|uniref:Uncharacterized protein n=1 Tax=Champsocephalus esox TaxID=159716 RepID=A0AAN8GBF9_9TELE|nr:hypothetical protein CesoFtcFv8_025714 [Champsocephalus esox]
MNHQVLSAHQQLCVEERRCSVAAVQSQTRAPTRRRAAGGLAAESGGAKGLTAAVQQETTHHHHSRTVCIGAAQCATSHRRLVTMCVNSQHVMLGN